MSYYQVIPPSPFFSGEGPTFPHSPPFAGRARPTGGLLGGFGRASPPSRPPQWGARNGVAKRHPITRWLAGIGCAPFQPYFCPAALRPLSRLAALGTAAPKPGSKRSPAACPLAAQRAARGLAPAACGLGARASARAARGAHVAAPPASRKSARGTLSPEPKRPPGSPGNGEGRRGGSVLSILSSTPGYVNSQLLFLLTLRKICGMISLRSGVAPPICCGYL